MQAYFDKSPQGCHGTLKVSAGRTVVTAVHLPRYVAFAMVRVLPHRVALGQQGCLTLKVLNAYGVAIVVLPMWHPPLSSGSQDVPGYRNSGCCWWRYGGWAYFYNGGQGHDAPAVFDRDDEVSVAVDRHTSSGNSSNGAVWFLRNGKPLANTQPLPIQFAEEATLVVGFGNRQGKAKIVSFL